MEGIVLSGRYRILRKLGSGAMGAVFEARDLDNDTRAAVKVLSAGYAESERVRRSFQAAARQAARLVHPNIVRCIGPGDIGDPYAHWVTELLDGAALTTYLKPGLAYDPPYALPIVRAILVALGQAHDNGIVHGNLKPENIFLVRAPNGPPIVKVLDFGMLEVINAAGGVTARSPAGEMLGHAGYLSPEQVRGASSIDARADLWSVGVLLYELLTGREAFPGPNDDAKLKAVSQSEPPAIDHGKPELLPWKAFFSKILARDVDHRVASAAAMEQALLWAADEAGQAKPRPATATTDMSPELPPGVGVRRNLSARPVVVMSPGSGDGGQPSPRISEISELPPRVVMTGVPIWVLLVVALICAALGFAAGLLAGER
jgi:serine/threonine-protein kinase